MFYDTHCHLNHPQFEDDLEETLKRMRVAQVRRCLVVGYDLPSSKLATDLSARYEDIYAAVGIHPHEADAFNSQMKEEILSLLEKPKVVAIGEIGLDYHYDFSTPENQMRALLEQLQIAQESGKPIIFHCRDAYEPLLDMLEKYNIRGVMHCWAGTKEQAQRAISMGLHLGFGGMVTFKKAAVICEVVSIAPMEAILLETDAPYLAPTPYRGKRNEPAYVRLVAEKVADIKGMQPEMLQHCTWRNSLSLFHACEN